MLGDEDEVLVVGSNLPSVAASEDIAEGDVVQVTGTVQAFDEAEFEREIGDDVLLNTPPSSSALTEDQALEVDGRVVEICTEQLVNALDLETEDELFSELEVSEDDIEDYDVAVVAATVAPRR